MDTVSLKLKSAQLFNNGYFRGEIAVNKPCRLAEIQYFLAYYCYIFEDFEHEEVTCNDISAFSEDGVHYEWYEPYGEYELFVVFEMVGEEYYVTKILFDYPENNDLDNKKISKTSIVWGDGMSIRWEVLDEN